MYIKFKPTKFNKIKKAFIKTTLSHPIPTIATAQ